MQSFAYKIITDISKAIRSETIDTFEVVPTAPRDQNTSPVLKERGVLGLESWAVRYVLPYAHEIVLNKGLNDNATVFSNCLLAVNLLNPEMPTAWCRRKELVMLGKSSASDELKVTRLALSVAPKCNEALAHRRWLLSNKLLPRSTEEMLRGELALTEVIAARYPSNYHAWCHRQWCFHNLLRGPHHGRNSRLSSEHIPMPKNLMIHIFNSTNLPIYLRELEDNFLFISRHVSDYSGMHHRIFILEDIFKIIREEASDSSPDGLGTNIEALNFYNNLRENIVDFFSDSQELPGREFMARFEGTLTVFDVSISIIVKDLKANMLLNQTFEYHESLWCYRRFLVRKLCEFIADIRTHCDSTANALLQQFNRTEENFLNECIEKQGVLYDSRIVKNYCNWLREIAKLKINLIKQP